MGEGREEVTTEEEVVGVGDFEAAVGEETEEAAAGTTPFFWIGGLLDLDPNSSKIRDVCKKNFFFFFVCRQYLRSNKKEMIGKITIWSFFK